MWVCLCKGVTDGQIRSAINAGARTPGEIGAHCRAGTGCGGCLPEVSRVLDDHLTSQAFYADPVRRLPAPPRRRLGAPLRLACAQFPEAHRRRSYAGRLGSPPAFIPAPVTP